MRKIKQSLEAATFAKNRQTINLVLLCVSVLALATVVVFSASAVTNVQEAAIISVPLGLLFCLTVFFAGGKKAFDLPVDRFFAILLFSGFAILIRYLFLSWRSSDYIVCVEHWLSHVREMPGATSLAETIGNYNAPYFYILFGIGKLTNISLEMFYTKFVSMLFDIIAAYYVMRLVSLKDTSGFVRLGAFYTVLLLPTVILNSSVWAQCDSIYAAFCLAGLYYGILRRGKLALLFFALALSFKLQTVFILPIVILFLILGYVRWKDLWVFPAAFCALLLPAVLAGRGIADTLSVYINQTTDFSVTTLRCPNLFGLLGMTTMAPAIEYAFILISGFGCLAFLFLLYRFRANLNPELVGQSAFVFVLIIPFTLPHMHERYFYLADLLAVMYAFWFGKRWYTAVIVAVSSFLCYLPFLFGNDYAPPFELQWLSLAMLAVIGIVVKHTVSDIVKQQTVVLEQDGNQT